jgi:UV DNA damage endonuclease
MYKQELYAMKIGYPCINLTLDCKGTKSFRLKSYSEKRFKETVENNLNCLFEILKYNVKHQILFFRITSDLIPFASHPICTYPWQDVYFSTFKEIGSYIKKSHVRISMHPDQFIVLNAKDNDIVNRSIKEINYHSEVLNLLQLDTTAKIQIHIGGVYGDKKASIERFIKKFQSLDEKIKQRVVIENDHQRYHLQDCLRLSEILSVPVLFDYYHHQIYNNSEKMEQALADYVRTWNKEDGIPLCDYSSNQSNSPQGSHAHTINTKDFRHFLELTKPYDIDIMLEIKDKEHSAVKAINTAKSDKRLFKVK